MFDRARSGLELEKFRMDLIPDDNSSLQHAKTVRIPAVASRTVEAVNLELTS